jgi:hypothetical protein
MDEEIKQLQARIQELERQKKEEEERNRDPFRHLRQRIKDHTEEMKIYNPKNGEHKDAIRITLREIECDRSILQAIESLQAEVKELRKQLPNNRQIANVDCFVLSA